MADGPIETVIDGRAVTIMPAPPAPPPRTKTVASVSVGRFLKLFLCWLGVPLGPMVAMVSSPDGLGQDIGFAWFFAGLAMLGLNAAGVVTLRARRRIPIEDGG